MSHAVAERLSVNAARRLFHAIAAPLAGILKRPPPTDLVAAVSFGWSPPLMDDEPVDLPEPAYADPPVGAELAVAVMEAGLRAGVLEAFATYNPSLLQRQTQIVDDMVDALKARDLLLARQLRALREEKRQGRAALRGWVAHKKALDEGTPSQTVSPP